METKDISIDSWVSYDNEPTQIKRIDKYEVDTYDMNEISILELEPIQITHDILIKNGFEKSKDNITYQWKNNSYENGLISCYETKLPRHCFNFLMINPTCFQMKIEGDFNYIHELQNALKVCKINKEFNITNDKD